jgi:hypothetical protein
MNGGRSSFSPVRKKKGIRVPISRLIAFSQKNISDDSDDTDDRCVCVCGGVFLLNCEP